MSAANAASPSEPSMEEILASIRRIIADDEAPAERREDRRRQRSEAEAASFEQQTYAAPVLDRHETERREPTFGGEPRFETTAPIAEIRPLRPAIRDIEPAAEERVETGAADGPAQDPAGELDLVDESVGETGPLMSPDTASSIASQFETLAATMFLNDSGILRDYAQEMMRPMLKQWLDDNLPVIVERLVRAEIERVARGSRR